MRILLCCCLAFICRQGLIGNAVAATILPSPTMGVEGSHTFTAKPGKPDAAVIWKIQQITRLEESGGGEVVTTYLDNDKGEKITIDLPRVFNRQTIYRVTATDSTGTDTLDFQVFPSIADAKDANRNTGLFTFDTPGNPRIRVFLLVPQSISAKSKMLVVMHGGGRRAKERCLSWRDWVMARDTVIVCPEFTRDDWPDPKFSLGNVFTQNAAGSFTKLNDESKWTFTIVELAQKYVRKGFGLTDESFDMWGFSGGGQFVHRFPLFKPKAKLRRAMIAAPSWYMLPSLTTPYPFGAKHTQLSFDQGKLKEYSERNAVIFLGTADTKPPRKNYHLERDADGDEYFVPGMDQGEGRYARGRNFYDALKKFNPDTTWKCFEIPGAKHRVEPQVQAAQAWLENQPAGEACGPPPPPPAPPRKSK